jgi:hypothetical protein
MSLLRHWGAGHLKSLKDPGQCSNALLPPVGIQRVGQAFYRIFKTSIEMKRKK